MQGRKQGKLTSVTLCSKEDFGNARKVAFEAMKSRAYLYPLKVGNIAPSEAAKVDLLIAI